MKIDFEKIGRQGTIYKYNSLGRIKLETNFIFSLDFCAMNNFILFFYSRPLCYKCVGDWLNVSYVGVQTVQAKS